MTDVATTPTIILAATALRMISAEAIISLDGAETGGILLGPTPSDDSEVVVQHAGGPGPDAFRAPTRFDRDLRYAQRLADYAWHVDGSQWVGEWHTHPTGPMTPSDRDLASYYAHLSDAELGFRQFVCVIVAIRDDRSATLSGWIVRPAGVLAARLIAGGTSST
ncbi:Mov34/MPN/PAD-1 family protein [Microbacterium sp. R1]|nr:Mov34/MPN/PAD-1 family protein [Microbacterium sp. R1]MCV0336368.1 Mov34/MPN/PAD-1 family protein [Microbacterium sp.]MCV0376694.1 Mov34/MPN/PAD-1 family protein [Microbacterium sp.]MCV0391443.1 Mov34/MPN/PAD-1 family protein [Microbacterium sp.]MCV0420049.1 Mov34/MPN/PAD-1 family protein [Microbacterium sp.]